MSDDWVYVRSYEYHTQYYKKSSLIIDEDKNTINVLLKSVTERKKIGYLQNIYSIINPNYITFNQQLKWYLLNYKKRQFTISRITDYSKSGNILLDTQYKTKWLHNLIHDEWNDIMPDSIVDFLLDKLLQDNKIWNDFEVDIVNSNNYNLPDKSSKAMTIVNLLVSSITKNFN
ncbi:MAG: hypothetical protein Q7O12_08840 [Deltaproteobacteria bacterium]|nr:hypothetical protein [Deltaproteobacteria bacterium]